ncbi:MAG: hypothetical protein HY680_03560 [Chloroflexi bacterium]|nr:hypothetical protein [Chloroflexota bacterium]
MKSAWLAMFLNVFPIPLGFGYLYLGHSAKAGRTVLAMMAAALAYPVTLVSLLYLGILMDEGFLGDLFSPLYGPTDEFSYFLILVSATPTALLAAWVGSDAWRVARQMNGKESELPRRSLVVAIVAGACPLLAVAATIAGFVTYFRVLDWQLESRAVQRWEQDLAYYQSLITGWEQEGCKGMDGIPVASDADRRLLMVADSGAISLWDGSDLFEVAPAIRGRFLRSPRPDARVATLDGLGRIWLVEANGSLTIQSDKSPFESVPIPDSQRLSTFGKVYGVHASGRGQVAVLLTAYQDTEPNWIVLTNERWELTPGLPHDRPLWGLVGWAMDTTGRLWVSYSIGFPLSPDVEYRVVYLESGQWIEPSRPQELTYTTFLTSGNGDLWFWSGWSNIYTYAFAEGRFKEEADVVRLTPGKEWIDFHALHALDTIGTRTWVASKPGIFAVSAGQMKTYPFWFDTGWFNSGWASREGIIWVFFDPQGNLLFTGRDGELILCPPGAGPNKP